MRVMWQHMREFEALLRPRLVVGGPLTALAIAGVAIKEDWETGKGATTMLSYSANAIPARTMSATTIVVAIDTPHG
jgi:hypothetical protein